MTDKETDEKWLNWAVEAERGIPITAGAPGPYRRKHAPDEHLCTRSVLAIVFAIISALLALNAGVRALTGVVLPEWANHWAATIGAHAVTALVATAVVGFLFWRADVKEDRNYAKFAARDEAAGAEMVATASAPQPEMASPPP